MPAFPLKALEEGLEEHYRCSSSIQLAQPPAPLVTFSIKQTSARTLHGNENKTPAVIMQP